MSDPQYRVQLFKFADPTGGTDFGYGDLLAEFPNAKHLGYANYLNDVGESFCTVNQDDAALAALRGYEGKCHMRIWRNGDIVWNGWGALETDANQDDVILYGYGYVAGLYWTLSDWNVQYQGAQIDTIVSDLWTRAKTTLTHSTLGFVTTGTIEAPVTTSGGSTPVVLPKYSMFYKRLLFVLREMCSISMSDTTNNVVFEITNGATPTFNFWKNAGTDRSASLRWVWGGPEIAKFRAYGQPVYHRNNYYAVGSSPNNSALRKTGEDGTDLDTWGRRAEALYMTWVRDSTELENAARYRASRALRDITDLTIRFYPNTMIPAGATGATYALADTVQVVIDRGLTNIDSALLVSGQQVLWTGGAEHVNVLLQDRGGEFGT